MKTTVAVQWKTYVQCDMYICSGAYANNMKCMYTRVPGHIVDCSGLIWGICTDIEMVYVDMNWLACVAYVVFEGHISFCCVNDNNMMLVVPSVTALHFLCGDDGLEV